MDWKQEACGPHAHLNQINSIEEEYYKLWSKMKTFHQLLNFRLELVDQEFKAYELLFTSLYM